MEMNKYVCLFTKHALKSCSSTSYVKSCQYANPHKVVYLHITILATFVFFKTPHTTGAWDWKTALFF
mgnify:FL=1